MPNLDTAVGNIQLKSNMIISTDASTAPWSDAYYPSAKAVADKISAIAPDKIKAEIGWEPETMFKEGIKLTIQWYFEHEDWMKNVTSGDYQKYYADMYSEK